MTKVSDKKIQVAVLNALRASEDCAIDTGGGLTLIRATTRIGELHALVHDNGGSFGARGDSSLNWLLFQLVDPRLKTAHEFRWVSGNYAVFTLERVTFFEVVVLKFRSQTGEITPEKQERMMFILAMTEPAAKAALSKKITLATEEQGFKDCPKHWP